MSARTERREQADAFEVAWREVEARIKRALERYLAFLPRTQTNGKRSEREDIMQEAQLGAWRGLQSFDSKRGRLADHVALAAERAMRAYLRRQVKDRRLQAAVPGSRSAHDAFLHDLLRRGDEDGATESGDELVPDPSDNFAALRRQERAHRALVELVLAMPYSLREWAEAVLLDRASRSEMAAHFGVTERQAKEMAARVYAECRRHADVGAWLLDGERRARLASVVGIGGEPSDGERLGAAQPGQRGLPRAA